MILIQSEEVIKLYDITKFQLFLKVLTTVHSYSTWDFAPGDFCNGSLLHKLKLSVACCHTRSHGYPLVHIVMGTVV